MQDDLQSIFQQAVELRASQDAKLRVRFDATPNCVQKSLFYPSDTAGGNKVASTKREQGNALFHQDRIVDALAAFEDALVQVWWLRLKPDAPSFRSNGVRDEWIVFSNDSAVLEDKEEACVCLLNMASCLLKLKQWDECIQVCECAMVFGNQQAENQAKALYRSALAKQGRNHADDEESALGDLIRALPLHGLGGKVQAALDRAKAKRLFYLAKEKQMFAGALAQGDLYDPEPSFEAIREAREQFGLDITDPKIRAALKHMSKHMPTSVEELAHEKRSAEKKERFMGTCVLILLVMGLTIAVSYWLIREAAIRQHAFPRDWRVPADEKQTQLGNDEL
jgi:hypothetical protein